MTISKEQKKEIVEQQNQKNITKRVVSPELERRKCYGVYLKKLNSASSIEIILDKLFFVIKKVK